MERSRDAAIEMGMDWLGHFDDDELIHSMTGSPIGDILAYVRGCRICAMWRTWTR